MSEKIAYFVSDLHFGASYGKAEAGREERFHQFLKDITPKASHLFIIGDLFEFWMEYGHFIPKNHFATLSALGQIAQAGVEVHYLCGNHDFNLGSFFDQHLKIKTHSTSLSITLQGKKLFLIHGDGLAKSDWKYRLARKIIRHPLSNFCFKLLHPDWGMRLAFLVGKTSRDQHDYRPRLLEEYEAASRDLLKQGHDILIHGHTHAAFIKTFPEGIYINSGDWLQHTRYIEMRDGTCELREYKS